LTVEQFRVVPNTVAQPAQPAAVALTRLSLTEFRNYERLRIEVDATSVVLAGQNGAGKTNLLEAISLLAPGRGLRRARLSDLVRRDAGGTEVPGRAWAVAAHVATQLGETEVGTGLVPGSSATESDDEDDAAPERRVVRVDGRNRGPASLAGVLAVRWLTPAMDRLFVEAASARRRFLDHLAAGLDAGHSPRVNAYERALRERGRLLRDGISDRHWLSALEGTLAELGVAIAAARREYVARLASEIAAEAVTPLRLSVSGSVEDSLAEHPALAAETKFRDALAASRDHDAITGGASVGPHRSDLSVWHASGLPASQCSTGEQKALLLAIVRADVRLLSAAQGRPPLLLLDEVAAHLDERRRRELFDAALGCGAQVWATGTDRSLFRALEGRAQFFAAANGALTVA
jgi:DNA replication and repair protein RecF